MWKKQHPIDHYFNPNELKPFQSATTEIRRQKTLLTPPVLLGGRGWFDNASVCVCVRVGACANAINEWPLSKAQKVFKLCVNINCVCVCVQRA